MLAIVQFHPTIGIDNHQKQKQLCLSIPEYIQDYQTIENQIEQSIINNLIQEFTKLFSNEKKEFFDRFNSEYPSSDKPDQDRKRFLFNQLFQQYQNSNWNIFDEEQRISFIDSFSPLTCKWIVE